MKGEYKMIYLKQAKFCVQCDMIFNDRVEVCPVCWSPSWVPLEKWLNNPKEEAENILYTEIESNHMLQGMVGAG